MVVLTIPGTSFQDRFLNNDRKPQSNRGGRLGSCPRPTNDAFRDRGLSQCEDYTTSGHFTKTNLDEDGKLQFLLNFQLPSVVLNRGFRPGLSGRVNGGYSFDGGGGGGGAG